MLAHRNRTGSAAGKLRSCRYAQPSLPTPRRSAKFRPPQPTNAITGNQAAGICRSSRQRIAIGRSPSWLS
jgi:hypothetical protein